MRKLHLLALGALLLATPLSSQSWDTELGIQGGFSRFKLTGQPFSNAMIDMYAIPSTSILNAFPTTPAVFAIFPLKDKIALEGGLSFGQSATTLVGGVFPTFATVSLRADYAITSGLYGALGLYTRYAGGSPGTIAPYPHFQFGLEAAAGYRLHLTSRLNGRVELQAVTVKKQDTAVPFNVYSVLFGVSTALGASRPTAGTRRAAPESHGAWEPMLGVSAGYTDVHVVRGPDLTILSFPGSGSSSYQGIIAAPAAATVFALLPLNDRLAAEVGFDGSNLRGSGTTIASFQLAPRVDMAFGNRWYGALGPEFHFVRGSGKLEGQSGLNLAWGYRFHLSGALNGRFEANYGVYAKRRSSFNAGVPSSVFGLNFGMMMPLK